jgi:hypothetical protein
MHPQKRSVHRWRDTESKSGGLLHRHAFSARSLALFEKLNPAQSSSYISGLLIGGKIKSAKADGLDENTPLGSGNDQLTQRYILPWKPWDSLPRHWPMKSRGPAFGRWHITCTPMISFKLCT